MRPLTIEWVAPDCPPSTCFGPRLAQLTPDPGGFGFMPNGLAGPRIARSKVRFLAEARAIKPRGIFPSAPTRLLRNHSARPPGSSYRTAFALSQISRLGVVAGQVSGGSKPEVCCVYQITVSLSTEKVWRRFGKRRCSLFLLKVTQF